MNKLNPGQYERVLKNLRIANTAIQKAQEENQKLGIPNWYSINGTIISDQQLRIFKENQNSKS